jgi:hypothetical protein
VNRREAAGVIEDAAHGNPKVTLQDLAKALVVLHEEELYVYAVEHNSSPGRRVIETGLTRQEAHNIADTKVSYWDGKVLRARADQPESEWEEVES